MRMWWINPKYLCKQRLIGQHREIHMVLGALQKKRMSHHPLIRFLSQNGEAAAWNTAAYYHDLIVAEMFARGLFDHATPVSYRPNVDGEILIYEPQISARQVLADIIDLLERWSRYGQKGVPREEIPARAISVPTILELDDLQIRQLADFSDSVGPGVLLIGSGVQSA